MIKPKAALVTETIKRSYWKCMRDEHRHKKESRANICITSMGKPKHCNKWADNPGSKERALLLHEGGLSFSELGRQFGVSRERMRQVCKSAEWQRRRAIEYKSKGAA